MLEISKIVGRALILIFTCHALAAGAAARPAEKTAVARTIIDPEALEAFVDGVLIDAFQTDHIAGGAVAIVRGDRTVLLKGYGVAQLRPRKLVDPHRTLFRLASISKTMTWIAALQAIEEERIALDEPIDTYLPFALPTDAGPAPTLRQLMSHRSGFEDRALGRLFVDDPTKMRPLHQYLAEDPPKQVRPAGTVPSYSNYAVALAGAAVANRRREEFAALIERRILHPLGMHSSTFREPYPARSDLPEPMAPELAARLSRGFHWRGGRFVAQKFEYAHQLQPAASLSGTAEDIARYMRALLADGTLEGNAIYGTATASALRTPLLPSVDGGTAYHHGFRQYILPGGYQGIGHNGVTMAFLSNMVVIPELDLGIFITTNTETGAALVDRFPGLVVGHFFAPRALHLKVSDPRTADRSDWYSGNYMTLRRPYGGLGEFSYRLGNMVTASVDPDGLLIVQGRGGPKSYVRDGSAGSGTHRFVERSGSQRIVFTGEQKRANRIYASSGHEVFQRVPALLSPGLLKFISICAFLAAVFLSATPWRAREGFPRAVRVLLGLAGAAWVAGLLFFLHWASAAQDSLVVTFTWPGVLPVASIAMWISALAAGAALMGMVLAPIRTLPAPIRFGWPAASLVLLLHAGLLAGWGAMTFWQW